MFKSKFFLLFIFLGVLFIPNNVEAATTVTVCHSGCDYNNFETLYNDYKNDILKEKDLTVKVGEGEYNDAYYLGWLSGSGNDSLTVKGISKEETKFVDFRFYGEKGYISFENISFYINDPESFLIIRANIELNNIDIYYDYIIDYNNGEQLLYFQEPSSVVINNVTVNSNIKLDDSITDPKYFDCIYIGSNIDNSTDVKIDNLTINNNGSRFKKGLILDSVKNASVNNLTVNNSEVGLYVHRYDFNGIESNVEVNNSNLLNNTCSTFNVLDKNNIAMGDPTDNDNSNLEASLLPFTNNKNYQVIFNKNNLLNCAVASGSDTNTYISGENTWDKEPTIYTYDEINYDDLTNTVQNANNGTVDIAKTYKGTVTIEEGSSVDDNNAFDVELNLDVVNWTSNDESIARIENGKILGLKEGTTTITGVSSDGLTNYLIEVNVIKNPVTNSMIYVGIGVILILVLGTILYIIYRKKRGKIK